MAWSLKFDGVNDHAPVASPVFGITDFTFRFGFLYVAGSNQAIMGNSNTNDDILRLTNTTSFLVKCGGTSVTLTLSTALIVGQRYVFNVVRSGSTIDIQDDSGSSLVNATGATITLIDLYGFGRISAGQYFKGELDFFEHYSDSTKTILENQWDATASSHGSGTPVLVDTIGGNNATGVNMPTDGSAWIDLGGSGITVTATLGTIDYTSQNTNVALTGSIDLTTTLGTINYSSNNTTVSLDGGTIVNATLGTIDYTSQNATVLLSGLVEVTATLGAIVYNSYPVIIQVGEGQVIGNITAGFADDLYAASFKPDTITVSFK